MATDASDTSADLKQVFRDEDFWYKIDVDWEDVLDTARSEQADEGADELGRSSEGNSSYPDDFPKALLEEFAKGKKKVIEEEFEAVELFVSSLQKKNEGEIKQILRTLYVEHQWSLKQKQDTFTCGSIDDVFSKLSSDSTVIRDEINDTFDILWPGNLRIDKEVHGDEVMARKLLKTKPVIAKKDGDSKFLIRGSGKSRRKIVRRVNNTGAESVEPDRKEEEVSHRIHSALSQEDGSFDDNFKIVSINYSDASLPSRPELGMKSDKGLSNDLYELREAGFLPTKGMAGLEWFRVEDLAYGGRHKIELGHVDDGFLFKSQATRKTDNERDRFERRFSRIVGIEFDTIYEYGSEDSRYLLNRILTGDFDAYDSFYSQLENAHQEFLDDVLETDDDGDIKILKAKYCRVCGAEEAPECDTCDECGEDDFSDPYPVSTIVDDNSISTRINEELKDVSPTHSRVEFISFSTTTTKMSDNRVVRADITLHRSPGQASSTTKRQIYFAPTNRGNRIRRFNKNLLEASYLTYGSSDGRQLVGFGNMPLYDLLFNDSEQEVNRLVGRALYDAIDGVQDRILEHSREAHEVCKKYLTTAERVGPIHENEERLKQYLTGPNHFEKQVFYLLKSVFEQTERWGKESEREADGAIVFPRNDRDKFRVFSYDAKLSFAEGGYNLDPATEDQATRYILNDEDWERLKVKTGDRNLDAHILISQHLNEDQYSKMAENVIDHFDVFTGDDVDTKIVFMNLRGLIDLFELKRELFEYSSSSKVIGEFNRFFYDEVRKNEEGEKFSLLYPENVERINEKITRVTDEFNDEKLRPYSMDARDEE